MSDQTKEYIKDLVRLAKQNLIAIGYQNLTIDNTSGGVSLTVPLTAKYALIVVESSVIDGTAVIRYLETGPAFPVTNSNGIPRAHLEVFDIQGYQNLVNTKLIQAQAGTHNIQIQYYK